MKRLLLGLLSALILVGAACGVALLWGHSQYRAFVETPVTPPGGVAELTVKPGTSLRALGRELEGAGLIRDKTLPVVGSLFYVWAHKVEGLGSRIRVGEYLFEGDHTPAQVMDEIVSGRVRTYRVTIPEGLRLDEVMPLFEDAGLASAEELMQLAFDEQFVRGLGVEAASLEGYFFPTTYHLARGLGAERIMRAAHSQFEAAWRAAEAQRRDGVDLSKHEAVTLASIIEKETGKPEERPKVACVFHNRLREGWRLQTDPTVIYAKIMREGRWDGRITRADLERSHPYNTYTTAGLPPGPIAAPGAAALAAALNPPDCPYFFFVSRNDGSHVFCADYACHSRAVRRYQNPRYGLDR